MARYYYRPFHYDHDNPLACVFDFFLYLFFVTCVHVIWTTSNLFLLKILRPQTIWNTSFKSHQHHMRMQTSLVPSEGRGKSPTAAPNHVLESRCSDRYDAFAIDNILHWLFPKSYGQCVTQVTIHVYSLLFRCCALTLWECLSDCFFAFFTTNYQPFS